MAEPTDLLSTIKREIYHTLVDHGVGADDARHATADACRRILLAYGGERQWLPKYDRVTRNTLIIEHVCAGTPPEAIAKTLTISRRTVDRVSKHVSVGLGRLDWVL